MNFFRRIYEAMLETQRLELAARANAKHTEGWRHVSGLLVAGDPPSKIRILLNSLPDGDTELPRSFKKGAYMALQAWEDDHSNRMAVYALAEKKVDNSYAIREMYLPIIYELVGRLGGTVEVKRSSMQMAQGNQVTITNDMDLTIVRIK